MPSVLSRPRLPTGETFRIFNERHGRFLGASGNKVQMFEQSQCLQQPGINLDWQLVDCPQQPEAFYVINLEQQTFLDTHGTGVWLWNAGGKAKHIVIAENTSPHAGNIRWEVLHCPHDPASFYIVNVGHGKFLDTHGSTLQVWNNGGRRVETIIEENLSEAAGNLRWQLQFFKAQDPYGDRALSSASPRASGAVRILHLSDTHSMHRAIEAEFPLPEADILVHTGDFSNEGSDAEIADFDAWLGELRPRYRHIVVIPGNHDWWTVGERVDQGLLDPAEVILPGFFQGRFKNCRVLMQEEEVLCGLRIFGSSWMPYQACGRPDQVGKRKGQQRLWEAWRDAGGASDVFANLPGGIDVLLSHGPAADIMDCAGSKPGQGWGSSKLLRHAIEKSGPSAHLFGHLREQRGLWSKLPGGYVGGIEYEAVPGSGKPWPTTGPPPQDYPCEVVSCNAMANHPGHEGIEKKHIAAPGRLILLNPRKMRRTG